MSQKKDRSPEEVAAEFAGTRRIMDTSFTPNDEPERDHAREAGLTKVGTVSDGTEDADTEAQEAEIRRLEAELRGEVDQGRQQPGQAEASMGSIPISAMERMFKMMADALSKIAAGQNESALVAKHALEEAARQQQPDNKVGPGISVFNPQGDLSFPRPKLKCPMFIPWEAEQESLTWEEIELLNLLEDGEYAVKRNDGVKVAVKVKIHMNLNGRPDRLLMNSENQFNDDTHWLMPSLVSILRQILASRPHTKEAATKVVSMDDREAGVESGELAISVGHR